MKFSRILSLVFVILIINFLIIYWFIPSGKVEFEYESYNFSLNNFNESYTNMQFYQNMRYKSPQISYRIYDCPLNKKYEMQRAFNILSNKSNLSFYPILGNEEISVTCDSKNYAASEKGLFVAGEGGPVNITKTKKFSVILEGKVLLIKESGCPRPNVALHELLHALGFNHSTNPKNIMFPISDCDQIIGDDLFNLINYIYSSPSYPDLSFENVSAVMHGKYLDINISLRNNGLQASEKAKLIITSGNSIVKEFYIDPLDIGYGSIIALSNVWIPKLNVKKLDLFIESDFKEISQENNQISLEIKS
jgi:hypothetical protein